MHWQSCWQDERKSRTPDYQDSFIALVWHKELYNEETDVNKKKNSSVRIKKLKLLFTRGLVKLRGEYHMVERNILLTPSLYRGCLVLATVILLVSYNTRSVYTPYKWHCLYNLYRNVGLEEQCVMERYSLQYKQTCCFKCELVLLLSGYNIFQKTNFTMVGHITSNSM